jgi:hypothetical protein
MNEPDEENDAVGTPEIYKYKDVVKRGEKPLMPFKHLNSQSQGYYLQSSGQNPPRQGDWSVTNDDSEELRIGASEGKSDIRQEVQDTYLVNNTAGVSNEERQALGGAGAGSERHKLLHGTFGKPPEPASLQESLLNDSNYLSMGDLHQAEIKPDAEAALEVNSRRPVHTSVK